MQKVKKHPNYNKFVNAALMLNSTIGALGDDLNDDAKLEILYNILTSELL